MMIAVAVNINTNAIHNIRRPGWDEVSLSERG